MAQYIQREHIAPHTRPPIHINKSGAVIYLYTYSTRIPSIWYHI